MILLMLFTALCCIGVEAGPLPPFNLMCQNNLVGLSAHQMIQLPKQHLFGTESPSPKLSWTVQHTDRSAIQMAYQVIVSEAIDFGTITVIWDTEKTPSNQTSVFYAGPKLVSGTMYFWKVRWWDQQSHMAESLETGHFITGVLEPSDWDGIPWITAPPAITSAPAFSNMAKIDPSAVKQATLMISGLGFCKPVVNSVDLNARFDPPIALSPGWTNYDRRVPYAVYDVTDLITKSPNNEVRIDVMLGVGWRNPTDYPLKDSHSGPSKDMIPRVLRLQLRVAFSNQTTTNVLMSDATWSVANSPIMSDSIYNGEVCNFKSRVSKLYSAVVTEGPNGQMYLPEIPPIVEAGIEKAVNIYNRKDSSGKVISQIIDFGNNSAGYCKLNMKGSTNVVIQHAEVPMHPPYGPTDGSLYYGNLRSAKQMDTIMSDGLLDVYKPTFTYHGFRYAEITGYNGTITADDIQKIVVHTNIPFNGNVQTSSKILNAIYSSAVRSQLSNLMSVPTDCDQRDERLGWMGDAGLSALSMTFNFNMQPFHENYIKIIVDDLIDGTLPDVVPYYRYGSRPADPAWGHALAEIITSMYLLSHDMNYLKEQFDNVFEYVTTLAKKIPPEGIGKFYSYYGDWVPPPEQLKVNGSFVSAFILITDIMYAEGFAFITNNTDRVKELNDMFSKTYDAFNDAFSNPDANYLNEIQATYVLPLSFYFWNSGDGITRSFVDTFMNNDKAHITSGIIGARYIFEALSDIAERNDLALELAEQVDYPSWGYMIYNPLEPATGLWELWNSHNGSAGMDSRNHHMFSSISLYIKSQGSGLVLPKNSYGLNIIHFFPASVLGLSYANVSLQFPKPVSISWQRNGGVQCSKSPEDQSPMSPTLPKHGGLVVSCGDEEGGVVAEVTFASFGNPSGQCGGYYKINSCHAVKSVGIVEELCLGKRLCSVPTGVDYWGDPCPGQSKWLTVEVQCQSSTPHYKYSSITAQVSVPIGSKASLFLPAYGKKDFTVWESDKVIFDERQELMKVPGIIQSRWNAMKDSLVVDLESGDYLFTARGVTPNIYCVSSDLKNIAVLACEENTSEVITNIDWLSYGYPVTDSSCMFPKIGDCHVSSSIAVVKQKCIGKQSCKILISESTFGKIECLRSVKNARVVVKYSCTDRFVW